MENYIAIDWGSTNLRAWRYQKGQCIEQRRAPDGITRLGNRTPAEIFATITDQWLEPGTLVVMAGMVGSNVGW
ncbi:MAG: 2-dehydro-3-deoxygalactonokinase, partial [Enterobacteriaceae bacterium]